MEHYFNTNKETGETLKESNEKAKTQEERILAWFKSSPSRFRFTPESIMSLFNTIYSETPLTSIRRAFSNLQKNGSIEKTGEMTMGKYGKMIHTWRLK